MVYTHIGIGYSMFIQHMVEYVDIQCTMYNVHCTLYTHTYIYAYL